MMRFLVSVRGFFLPAALWIIACGANAGATSQDTDWPLSWQSLEAFSAGDYSRVIAEAPEALRDEPYNDELRLAYGVSLLWTGDAWDSADSFRRLLDSEFSDIATLRLGNALAWTGRMVKAAPYYESLLDGPLDQDARLGLADAQRWRGRQDISLPHYRIALENDADSEEAANGRLFSDRVLRPRTEMGINSKRDNTIMRRNEAFLRHTWRDDTQTRIYSVEVVRGREWDEQTHLHQQEFSFRFEDLAARWAPMLEISAQNLPERELFGHLRLMLLDTPVYLNLARVNWARMAFEVNAMEAELTANQIGLQGKQPTALGEFRSYVNYFDVSDGNGVINGDLRLTPWWRPYGPEVRPYIGVNWRYSDFTADEYWSPDAYAAGYLGVEGEWETPGWYLFVFADVGTGLAGEAQPYWSAGLTVKRWLDRDWALGANLWAQSSVREGNYRAHGIGLKLERLW